MTILQVPLNDEEFGRLVERLGADDDAIIEHMVQEGWELGLDENGGNIFWPPEE